MSVGVKELTLSIIARAFTDRVDGDALLPEEIFRISCVRFVIVSDAVSPEST
jgi:hypothetical protein